jgi:translation elongation factor EF-4
MQQGLQNILCPVKSILPMTYSGIYPIDPEEYKDLREAHEKLKLNDSLCPGSRKRLKRSALGSAQVS